MRTRRIFTASSEVIELLSQDGQSALKVQIFRGAKGNLQVFAFSQPEAHIALDPSHADRQHIRENDPAGE